MKLNKKVLTIGFLSVLLSSIAFAASDINTTLNNLENIVTTLTRLAYLAAFFAFFWFLAKYLLTKSDEDKAKHLKSMIIAVVVIFVMTSIWGIVKLLQNTLGATDNSAIDMQVPGLNITK